MANQLPEHLKKYIVEQDEAKYTPIDQACWRYIMRQLRDFLCIHAHESYIEGLAQTGISTDHIPQISEISSHLEKFGWRALPVSGFIPPAAFMELQALSVLPIASDMRTLGHIMYTPAPDIVHEAAGHAPLLANKEFSDYLKTYAQVARKAIISREDLEVYSAIRELSDIKEHPQSSQTDIDKAQKKLEQVSKQTSHISEASQLSRMNWWTAEYGLIGSLDNPKIFGAGLLSSVGEAKSCLKANVKKIPLTVDCIHQTYDITEQQPQLFVTPDFKTLTTVLEDFAKQMAFNVGGIEGINKAIQAESVNTVELDSGIQISGICKSAICDTQNSKNIIYLQFSGPSQLCYKDQQLDEQGKDYHQHGYSTAIGEIKNPTGSGKINLSSCQETDLNNWGWKKNNKIQIDYISGIHISGVLQNCVFHNGKLLLLAFSECTVTDKNSGQKLFDPSWGVYDLAIGNQVTSVFGGPADRKAYGEGQDFVAARVPQKKYPEQELQKHQLYQNVRNLRNTVKSNIHLNAEIQCIYERALSIASQDWLLFLECYELACMSEQTTNLKPILLSKLNDLKTVSKEQKQMIEDGLHLIGPHV